MRRALVYIAIAIGLLYAVRAIEYAGLRRNEGGEFEKLKIAFEEENDFDLVVIGSSRAECQYYTPFIDSATGLRCYNLGMTGATMPFIASTLEAYLVHSKAPKYIILNLDLHSLGDNTDTVYRFPRYFAFLDNEKLYDGLRKRDDRFLYFRWLPFYSMPYFNNRYLSNSLRGWMNKPSKYDLNYESGFSPCNNAASWGDLHTATMIQTHAYISQAIWDAVNKIETVCQTKNIQLIFAVSPIFHRQEECVTDYTSAHDAFHEYAQNHSHPFIDLGHDSLRYEKEMYADPAHLNADGARLFTRTFCAELGQYLDK
jgi:hypothetical protein